jgi:hypothetical protein
MCFQSEPAGWVGVRILLLLNSLLLKIPIFSVVVLHMIQSSWRCIDELKFVLIFCFDALIGGVQSGVCLRACGIAPYGGYEVMDLPTG